jgi:uncharacterized phage protein (TIGR02218 family)
MREVPTALQAHLDGGVTTLARCWRVMLAGGEAMGFTDHDRDMAFDGVTYRAATGFVGSAVESRLGLSVGDASVAGVLSDDGIDAGALEAGAYDGAVVTLFLVNWQDVVQRVVLAESSIGEVKRRGQAFEAELRSVSAQLNVPVGRTYQPVCDAVLGDAQCGVDVASFGAAATVVSSVDGRVLMVSGLEAFDDGWFALGRLTWTSGANEGLTAEVRGHGGAEIELWRAAPYAVEAGDTAVMVAGCDKRFATCRAKFSNGLNFRGCPHMPGNDWVTSYPATGERLDGSSLTS